MKGSSYNYSASSVDVVLMQVTLYSTLHSSFAFYPLEELFNFFFH